MPCASVETETASSELLALFSGDEERLVVIMEAFIDESGTHKGAPTVSVGATLGAHWQWKKFLSHWGDKPFHAKDPRCTALKLGLFEAMEFAEVTGFSAWISPEDYKVTATEHFKTGLGNAYAVCALSCAIAVCKFCRARDLGKIAFVIEEGQPNVGFVRSALEYMMSRDRFTIASVAVAKKKDFVQLCTADFLAYSRTSDDAWYQELLNTGRI